MTEFNDGLTTSVGAWGITAASDGNLRFTEDASNAFAGITPSAVITEFPDAVLGGRPRGIASGPDGKLWIAEAGGNGAIARSRRTAPSRSSPPGLTVGDRWVTVDRCDGTLTSVRQGAVSVRDFVRHRRVLVRAGHSYLARSRAALRRAHRRHR